MAPAPPKPGVKGKALPKWVWIVAIAGGLAVGWLLLRKSPSQGEGGEGESGAGGEGSGGGISVAAPLDDMAQAMGLKPPWASGGFDVGGGDSGYDPGTGYSGYESGLGPVGPSGSQLTPAQSTAQTSLGGLTPAQSTAQTSLGGPTQGTSTTTSSAGALGAGPTAGGGGGSAFFKAA